MKDWLCKLYCPSFVCFCKSPVPVFSPCTLKLEDDQHVPSCFPSSPVALEKPSDVKIESEKDRVNKQGEVIVLKSGLRKSDGSSSKDEVVKGRVQWIDTTGKELAEIKEYEPSESGECCDDGGNNRACVCVIQ